MVFPETQPIIGSDAYYEALRAYKKSDHAICFGWWGASGAAGIGPDMAPRYLGLPDSMDIVSLWGGMPKDEANWEELRYCQRVKGTRFVSVMFGSGVDRLRQRNFPGMEVLQSIDSVAKSIADTVSKYGLDGFDLDYEPGEGGERATIFGNSHAVDGRNPNVLRLFQQLGKYLGPQSGTGRLLIIDGYNEPGVSGYVDYLVQQAYGTRNFASLQSRFLRFGLGELPPEKFVVTENMQQFGPSGAQFMLNGENIGSVLGMAYWNPTQGRKGGFGGYIIEADAKSRPPQSYYYLRRGIQIQNPAVY
ncbi:endoglycosidase [Sphingobacterium griseoflavum]|uniref:mannosyl-glycoprotein endo-beta-N-acetylglucosaminidase n=1 Tax=Sphingobacterium griseoflavum TaxID=1474952 RepID=A0ABQ3HZU7_9SPHI|nr:endoglycosidase [Sphingobacterium griseoflavum]